VRRVDFVGSILLLAATVLLVLGLQQGGSATWSWNNLPVITILVASGVSWVSFIVWEVWLSRRQGVVEPLFPLRLARKRVYMSSLA